MSKHIDTIDELTRAKWMFEAALMAAQSLEDERECGALDRLLFEAVEILNHGIEMLRSLKETDPYGGRRV